MNIKFARGIAEVKKNINFVTGKFCALLNFYLIFLNFVGTCNFVLNFMLIVFCNREYS